MMNKLLIKLFLAANILTAGSMAYAITGVNPSGVNVSHTSPSTVFLTFQNLSPNQQPIDAFWCGAVTTTAVSSSNPCIPGTLFGHLPQRNNIGQASGTTGIKNFTDIMSIPSSVARRAYQDAQRGNDSRFFYVRHFANPQQFVVVTCRLAGGGARSPFALVDVRLHFTDNQPVAVIAQGETTPQISAEIRFTGTGRLTGRWEVVQPGDIEPTAFDLLPQASLPIEKRGLQRRYTMLQRFDRFLPPSGQVTIPGPNPDAIPHSGNGYYKLLFRVEATRERESNSNTVSQVVAAGGAAGFPMPMLRYYVGSSEETFIGNQAPKLFAPRTSIAANNPFSFTWSGTRSVYDRLEVARNDSIILTSIVPGSQGNYQAPPWINDHKGKSLKWRVSTLDAKGKTLQTSPWQVFSITATTASNAR